MRLNVEPKDVKKIFFRGGIYKPALVLKRPKDVYWAEIPYFVKEKCDNERISPDSIVILKGIYTHFYHYTSNRKAIRLLRKQIKIEM